MAASGFLCVLLLQLDVHFGIRTSQVGTVCKQCSNKLARTACEHRASGGQNCVRDVKAIELAYAVFKRRFAMLIEVSLRGEVDMHHPIAATCSPSFPQLGRRTSFCLVLEPIAATAKELLIRDKLCASFGLNATCANPARHTAWTGNTEGNHTPINQWFLRTRSCVFAKTYPDGKFWNVHGS